MGIYEDFAFLYATGDYPEYSQNIAKIFPGFLEELKVTPQTILDLACGEGTFAVMMAKQGFQVTGVDQSAEMLKYAKKKAKDAKVKITWIQQDMRTLNFSAQFDLVTCWFDSLNYLLELEDLIATFKGIHHALTEGGLFAFDLNTIYGLITLAQRHPCVVKRETSEIFEVHRVTYDYEQNLATFRIIGFLNEKNRWLRQIDEAHRERGYTLEEIKRSLKEVGFQICACWGNPQEKTPVTAESRRVFFIAKK